MSSSPTHQPPSPVTGSARTDAGSPSDRKNPGWPELIVGLVIWTVGVFVLSPQIGRLGLDPATHGVILTFFGGALGVTAFAIAVPLRIRSFSTFGLRRVSARWLLIGLAAGVVTLVLKSVASGAYIMLTGDNSNPQSSYAEGAAGGALYLFAATIFLGLLTPLGEELLFRGVVANALLRYGPIVGVGGSALIFALFHGINPVFPGALVIGLVTAELLRRSGSLWPSLIVHIVCNLPAPLITVIAGLS